MEGKRWHGNADVLAHVRESIGELVERLEPALKPSTRPVTHSMVILETPFVTMSWPARRSWVTGWQYNPYGGWAISRTPQLHELTRADIARSVPRWEQPPELTRLGELASPVRFARVAHTLLVKYRRASEDEPARRAV